MPLRHTVDFLLYDWLKVHSLQTRARFADHSRETFDAVLDTCERIAREKFAPFNRLVDIEEPRLEGDKVILPQATHDAYKAYAESGMLSAAQDYEVGGMQLPYLVEAAAGVFFGFFLRLVGCGTERRLAVLLVFLLAHLPLRSFRIGLCAALRTRGLLLFRLLCRLRRSTEHVFQWLFPVNLLHAERVPTVCARLLLNSL